jgi:hypothetical protein
VSRRSDRTTKERSIDLSLIMDRRLKESKVTVPVRPVRDVAREAAEDLRTTSHRLQKWGVRIPAAGRVDRALTVLDDIARSGRITPEQRGNHEGFQSLQFGMDLRAIAISLPPGKIKELRADIEKCITGALISDPNNLEAAQFQSQLIVRSAFWQMGADPQVPAAARFGKGKRPDILIANGASEYGIEVKRPTKDATVLSNAKSASRQIGEPGLTGGVILDLTDCMIGVTPNKVDDLLLSQYERVAKLFFENGVGFLPGQSHMIVAGVFARPMWTVQADSGDAQVAVHSTSAVGAFGTSQGTISFRRAVWIRETFNEGMNKLGFTTAEET